MQLTSSIHKPFPWAMFLLTTCMPADHIGSADICICWLQLQMTSVSADQLVGWPLCLLTTTTLSCVHTVPVDICVCLSFCVWWPLFPLHCTTMLPAGQQCCEVKIQTPKLRTDWGSNPRARYLKISRIFLYTKTREGGIYNTFFQAFPTRFNTHHYY